MSDRKTPYTNHELFNLLCEKVKLPAHLQSALSYSETDEIKRANGLFWNRLEFSNYGGINLEIGLEYFDEGSKIIHLGCFKTQDTSLQAMEDMGKLLADLVYVMNDLVKSNKEDFEWEGYQILGIKANGQTSSYTSRYYTIGVTMREVVRLLKSYSYVRLFNYREHEEVYFYMDENDTLIECKSLEECKEKKQKANDDKEASNEEVLAISKRLLAENMEAYKELAK